MKKNGKRVHLKVYNPLKASRVWARCNDEFPSRLSANLGEVTCRRCLNLVAKEKD